MELGEGDPLLAASRGRERVRLIAKLCVLSFFSGTNNGYASAILGYVLARLEGGDGGDRLIPSGAYAPLIASGTHAGQLVGCPIGSYLACRIGRRGATLVGEMTVLLSVALGALAPSLPFLLAWRLAFGIGAGICITVKPLYIVEVSPPEWRGATLALMQAGNVMSAIACAGVDWLMGSGARWWRVQIGLGVLAPLI